MLRYTGSQPLATLQECGKPAVSRFRRMRVVLSQRFYGDLLFSTIEPIADESWSCGTLCQNASVGFIPGRGFQSQWCYLINNEYIKKHCSNSGKRSLRLKQEDWQREAGGIKKFCGLEEQRTKVGVGRLGRFEEKGRVCLFNVKLLCIYVCWKELRQTQPILCTSLNSLLLSA